ncbi:hypothetical protein A3L11_08355 [Thermococcus siculi]|uniref:Uncharacterized protein n=1 Tax=Thermococcus siculi TaxID=72803 RepID=A0A2Z2MRC8_9EURY|nr:hypothetical protein [Thermococcus siculi]ASJ09237.1 hypothetical protein A3L11_08355 [Thermococcus siculi]
MIVERLLHPPYTVLVMDLKKFERDKIIEGFRRRGAHVWKFSGDLDPELEVESFIASTYGGYVYVLRFKGETYLARAEERIRGKDWGEPGSYFVRDENGLKRFLLRELSLKSKLLLDIPSALIWMAIGLGIMSRIEENPVGSFLLIFLGFFFNDIAKVLEYLILGYCKA